MFARFAAVIVWVGCLSAFGSWSSAAESTVRIIVMDPLAAPLSCPCVEGYAQRKYEVLAEHLQESLGREVTVVFADALSVGLKQSDGQVDIVIGKDSVVRADAKAAKRKLVPVAKLTDKKGSTLQRGLIVVNRLDPAKEVKDLDGYTIIFGPSEADEKHSAALAVLKAANVSIPKSLHIDEACSDGACKVIDLGPESRTAAVISSYAQPLLEGCGTIKKGDLRVVGETKPVAFVTAFVSSSLDDADRKEITSALLSVNRSPKLLTALESLVGFIAYDSNAASKKK